MKEWNMVTPVSGHTVSHFKVPYSTYLS